MNHFFVAADEHHSPAMTKIIRLSSLHIYIWLLSLMQTYNAMEYNYSYPPYIIANLVAVVVVIAAMQWPTISRTLLGGIFIGAFATNLLIGIYNPNAYLQFGEFTTNAFYRSIILGPFSDHTRFYIIIIAICQLFIGIFTTYQGRLMKVAMIGGMVFLFAISPLGFGAAFPSTMMMGTSFIILLFKKIDLNIYDTLRQRMGFQN